MVSRKDIIAHKRIDERPLLRVYTTGSTGSGGLQNARLYWEAGNDSGRDAGWPIGSAHAFLRRGVVAPVVCSEAACSLLDTNADGEDVMVGSTTNQPRNPSPGLPSWVKPQL